LSARISTAFRRCAIDSSPLPCCARNVPSSERAFVRLRLEEYRFAERVNRARQIFQCDQRDRQVEMRLVGGRQPRSLFEVVERFPVMFVAPEQSADRDQEIGIAHLRQLARERKRLGVLLLSEKPLALDELADLLLVLALQPAGHLELTLGVGLASRPQIRSRELVVGLTPLRMKLHGCFVVDDAPGEIAEL
jgi:hypothetical protein